MKKHIEVLKSDINVKKAKLLSYLEKIRFVEKKLSDFTYFSKSKNISYSYIYPLNMTLKNSNSIFIDSSSINKDVNSINNNNNRILSKDEAYINLQSVRKNISEIENDIVLINEEEKLIDKGKYSICYNKNIVKIKSLNEDLNEIKEVLDWIIPEQIKYYKSILIKGFDTRDNGIVWILKKLIEFKSNIEYNDFPHFLSKLHIDYLIKLSHMETEYNQYKIILKGLKLRQKKLTDIQKEVVCQLTNANQVNILSKFKKSKNKNSTFFMFGNNNKNKIYSNIAKKSIISNSKLNITNKNSINFNNTINSKRNVSFNYKNLNTYEDSLIDVKSNPISNKSKKVNIEKNYTDKYTNSLKSRKSFVISRGSSLSDNESSKVTINKNNIELNNSCDDSKGSIDSFFVDFFKNTAKIQNKTTNKNLSYKYLNKEKENIEKLKIENNIKKQRLSILNNQEIGEQLDFVNNENMLINVAVDKLKRKMLTFANNEGVFEIDVTNDIRLSQYFEINMKSQEYFKEILRIKSKLEELDNYIKSYKKDKYNKLKTKFEIMIKNQNLYKILELDLIYACLFGNN